LFGVLYKIYNPLSYNVCGGWMSNNIIPSRPKKKDSDVGRAFSQIVCSSVSIIIGGV